jgi:hypothetical protein
MLVQEAKLTTRPEINLPFTRTEALYCPATSAANGAREWAKQFLRSWSWDVPHWLLAVCRLLLLVLGTGRTTQCEPSVGAGQGGTTLRPTISPTASAGDMPAGDVVAGGNPSTIQPRGSRASHFFRGAFAGLGDSLAIWRTMRRKMLSQGLKTQAMASLLREQFMRWQPA